MLDKVFLRKKLELLATYLSKLEPLVVSASINEIKGDDLKRPAIERYFQLAVDEMIDVNVHIIREGSFGAPDDLESTFVTLGQFKVLDEKFAKKIAPIVGARNMIIHRYEKLDLDIFLNNLKKNFSDFKEYMIQIDQFLKTKK